MKKKIQVYMLIESQIISLLDSVTKEGLNIILQHVLMWAYHHTNCIEFLDAAAALDAE